MNTNNKQDQNVQKQTRQQQRLKTQGRDSIALADPGKFQDHEHPEMRMTR